MNLQAAADLNLIAAPLWFIGAALCAIALALFSKDGGNG